ncbi:hypothetical protein [Lederbergia panacisoli]|uniref:hypothetical protein n=1 Tax=Lederbergia panacisoli TaxID=1255251 RepID=UPI00214AB203|nr:hypothetical protein [Lederbergia panacisoli]MCR2822256.1 hypothetical protein [Lederbergia panacisoli]
MLRLLLPSLMLFLSFQYGAVAHSSTFENCYKNFNNTIHQDILISFPMLKELAERDDTWNYSYEDLIKMNAILGKEDSHLISLVELFRGTSIGERQLIIVNGKYSPNWGNAFTGYLFYKDVKGVNILLEIKRGKKEWEVVKKRKVQGKYITLEKNC